MGDYFRHVINEDLPDMAPEQRAFVEQLKETLRRGHFVEDAMAIEVIKRARQIDHKDTPVLILDGMPRTVS